MEFYEIKFFLKWEIQLCNHYKLSLEKKFNGLRNYLCDTQCGTQKLPDLNYPQYNLKYERKYAVIYRQEIDQHM